MLVIEKKDLNIIIYVYIIMYYILYYSNNVIIYV